MKTDNSIVSNSSFLLTAKKHFQHHELNEDFRRKLISASKQANPGRHS